MYSKILAKSATFTLLILSSAFYLVNCCPGSPGCPEIPPTEPPPSPEPTTPSSDSPKDWNAMYEDENLELLEQSTQAVIAQGQSANFYAEALLYNGLAKLKIEGGDIELAESYLLEAENLVEKLSSIDKNYEQTLLYRGLMVASLRLKKLDDAVKYRDIAVTYSPELKDQIELEFKNASP